VSVALILLLPLAFEFNTPGGVGSSMLAGVAVPIAGNAGVLNPGLAGCLTSNSIKISTARLYEMGDIYCHQAAFGLRKVALAGRFTLLSSNGYQEFTGSVTKGFRVTDDLSFGAALSFYWLSISGEYAEGVPGLSAGVAYSHGVFGAGAAVHDFNRPAFVNGDAIPPRVAVGVTLSPYPNLRIAADGEYDNSLQFRFGTAFTFHPALTLAIGVGTNPLRYAAGLCCSFKGLGLDYTYSYHPLLRTSHMLGLGYTS
jgi:hypothetical protein